MYFEKRILLIAREPNLVQFVRRVLAEEAGQFLLMEEGNCAAAVQTARRFHPDLIFVDLLDCSGLARHLAQEIHSNPWLQDTPVVSLTSIVSGDEVSADGLFRGYTFHSARARLAELVRCVEDIAALEFASF